MPSWLLVHGSSALVNRFKNFRRWRASVHLDVSQKMYSAFDSTHDVRGCLFLFRSASSRFRSRLKKASVRCAFLILSFRPCLQKRSSNLLIPSDLPNVEVLIHPRKNFGVTLWRRHCTKKAMRDSILARLSALIIVWTSAWRRLVSGSADLIWWSTCCNMSMLLSMMMARDSLELIIQMKICLKAVNWLLYFVHGTSSGRKFSMFTKAKQIVACVT